MKLVRPLDNRIIAGVCAGLGERFNVSAWVIRILFILLVILPPAGIIPYVILWIIIPNEGSVRASVSK